MKLTFPYVFKPRKKQNEILEEIMWHCAKVYNMLNYDIQQGIEKVRFIKNTEKKIGIQNIYIHIHYKK